MSQKSELFNPILKHDPRWHLIYGKNQIHAQAVSVSCVFWLAGVVDIAADAEQQSEWIPLSAHCRAVRHLPQVLASFSLDLHPLMAASWIPLSVFQYGVTADAVLGFEVYLHNIKRIVWIKMKTDTDVEEVLLCPKTLFSLLIALVSALPRSGRHGRQDATSPLLWHTHSQLYSRRTCRRHNLRDHQRAHSSQRRSRFLSRGGCSCCIPHLPAGMAAF